MTATLPADAAPADILAAAADAIDDRGWAQDVYEDGPGGCLCVDGAIRLVATGNANGSLTPTGPATRARAALARAVNPASPFVTVWNDQPGRTKDHVTSTLRRVAAQLRATT